MGTLALNEAEWRFINNYLEACKMTDEDRGEENIEGENNDKQVALEEENKWNKIKKKVP